jgi:hypothetical protein
VDNDGAVRNSQPTMPGTDIGIQLWNTARRRQLPAEGEARP